MLKKVNNLYYIIELSINLILILCYFFDKTTPFSTCFFNYSRYGNKSSYKPHSYYT